MLQGHDWRLIIDDQPRRGSMNMAVDEAILVAHKEGKVPPTLSFYRWDPACVSIGYFQQHEKELDHEQCEARGVDWVRRSTGGRAVLHDNELTYSVVIRDDLLPGGVLETHRVISQGLVAAFQQLGLETKLEPELQRVPGAVSAACFDSPSSYELLVNGKKAVGSAQTRKEGVILQHGSIPLHWDLEKLTSVLRTPSERFRQRLVRTLSNKATSLFKELGQELSFEELSDVFSRGFKEGLDLVLTTEPLSDYELAVARELERDKYSSPEWNEKR